MAETPEVAGQEVGVVVGYFSHVGAAVIEVTQGKLKLGDTIWIKGHTTDLKQTVDSMQIERQAITEASPGKQVGLKVKDRVRRNDRVYKI